MPSEQWKIKNFKQKWYAGETISVGIGQGAVATTPIQLARAVGAITSDGVLVHPHVAFPDQFPTGFKQVASYTEETRLPIEEKNWITITDAMANVVSPMGTAGRAAIKGIDIAGKTGSAQTVSNDLKKKMSAKEKGQFKDNGWFVGVTPRRNPEIVVACLFEGGEHGALAAVVATKVIKAYVEKQRTRQTLVAKANGGTQPSGNKAEVAAVWHESDSNATNTAPTDRMQAGHFTIDTTGKVKSLASAPGMAKVKSAEEHELQTTESHPEMAEPEAQPTSQPAQPALRSEGEQPAPDPHSKKPGVQPGSTPSNPPAQPGTAIMPAPTAALVKESQP
jgi:penicillin-binding protein 2